MLPTECDEELGVIRIFLAIICHCDESTMREAKSRVDLIFKIVSVEGFTSPSSARTVTSLNEKAGNYSGEYDESELRFLRLSHMYLWKMTPS